MKTISCLCAFLLTVAVLLCAVDDVLGAPAKSRAIVAMPDVSQLDTPEPALERITGRKTPPITEGLHNIGEAPRKFIFAAGAIMGLVWFLAKLALFGFVVLVAIYFFRKQKVAKADGKNLDVVDALAAAFDEAVTKVKSKRRELQSKVSILDKRVEKIQPPVTKPKKRKSTNARKAAAK